MRRVYIGGVWGPGSRPPREEEKKKVGCECATHETASHVASLPGLCVPEEPGGLLGGSLAKAHRPRQRRALSLPCPSASRQRSANSGSRAWITGTASAVPAQCCGARALRRLQSHWQHRQISRRRSFWLIRTPKALLEGLPDDSIMGAGVGKDRGWHGRGAPPRRSTLMGPQPRPLLATLRLASCRRPHQSSMMTFRQLSACLPAPRGRLRDRLAERHRGSGSPGCTYRCSTRPQVS